MLSVIDASDSRRLAVMYRSGWSPSREQAELVAAALAGVRTRGDAALVDAMRSVTEGRFDLGHLRVPIPMDEGARSLVPPEIADALRLAKTRITRFHERQRHADSNFVDQDGSRYGVRYRPLESIAAYAGAGSAASIVMMTALPARIAGVGRVVVLAQPDAAGRIHPGVLFACSLCEVDELYAVGGPEAIAAAAFGTESIAPVCKIFGGSGSLVTEAKRQVFGTCAIDGLAGPSEVLVIADDGANSELVTGELLTQAERDVCARVGVVSESRPLLEAVAQLVDTLEVRTLARGEIIAEVIENSCFLIHAQNRDQVLSVANSFAPERVALHLRDAEPYLAQLRHVGAVFVGDATPVVEGDALAGINALQPACGAARFESGLTLGAFMRSFSVVENSRERMLGDAQPLAALAEFEGLPQHAQTARMRSGA